MRRLEKILHVEDDEDSRAILKTSLELEGNLSVEQCATGQEALELVPRVQPDLVLLDAIMPGMSGEETFSRLRKLPGFEAIPIIFVTTKASTSDIDQLMKLGALSVITKPYDPMQLISQIEAVWNRHYSV